MPTLVTLLLFSVVTVLGDEEKYTTKYDSVDFDDIIHSDRLLKGYVNCLMDRGPCTPDARELRRILPDALETDCKKCSEAQKTGLTKVIKHMIKNKRDWWQELEIKYDPDKKYRKMYKDKYELEGLTFDK